MQCIYTKEGGRQEERGRGRSRGQGGAAEGRSKPPAVWAPPPGGTARGGSQEGLNREGREQGKREEGGRGKRGRQKRDCRRAKSKASNPRKVRATNRARSVRSKASRLQRRTSLRKAKGRRVEVWAEREPNGSSLRPRHGSRGLELSGQG